MHRTIFHPSDYTIVHDPLWLDERYGVTPGIRLIMEEARPYILNGREQAIETMIAHCRRFPDVAPLKLYLKAAYTANQLFKKAEYVGHMLLQDHPEFLPGRLALAYDADVECLRDWYFELLGEQIELHLLYPERDTFHISEVTGYYHVAFNFYLFWQDYEGTGDCLQLLEEINPECGCTLEAKQEWSQHLLDEIRGGARGYGR